jgi:aarF domain-containing kinase
MLTSRPFDEIIERSKTGSLSAKIDPASRSDEAMIRGYAQHFLPDIFSMLGKLPRQMLLLLKMNDCLRHIDFSLGSPANTMIVAGRYATRALYEDQLQKAGRSVLSRFKVWINNFRIVWKIRFHYVQIWWESKTVRLLTGEG